MPRRIPRLKASDIISILKQQGFTYISQHGSHQKWRNQDTGKQVIVPFHKGKDLPYGTIKSVIDGSGIPEEKFKK